MVKMKGFESEFREFAVTNFTNLGFDDLSAKLIATLYLEPHEISMEELAKKTGYCLASISNKMHFLESLGQVHIITKPGSKKKYYVMEKDLFKLMKNKLDAAYTKYVEPVKTNLPILIAKYNGHGHNDEEQKKIQIMKDYYQQMLKMEKLINHTKEYMETLK